MKKKKIKCAFMSCVTWVQAALLSGQREKIGMNVLREEIGALYGLS